MSKAKKILVVEDDDGTWGVLQMILQALSCEIQRTDDGQKGLEMVRGGGFDAVLLDLMLPGMSGEDFLKHLDADPRFKGFPILVNSTSADIKGTKEKIAACRNLRIESLARPVDPEAILEAMRKLISLPATSPAPKMQIPKKKVLVVDDESSVRAMYLPYFAGKGYDAIAATNGKEALEVLKKENVALIILDLNMPEMSGEDVMAAMAASKTWKEIPIIIDTAVDPATGRLEAIRKNFEGKLRFEFFRRPTSLQELNEAIDSILYS